MSDRVDLTLLSIFQFKSSQRNHLHVYMSHQDHWLRRIVHNRKLPDNFQKIYLFCYHRFLKIKLALKETYLFKIPHVLPLHIF